MPTKESIIMSMNDLTSMFVNLDACARLQQLDGFYGTMKLLHGLLREIDLNKN